MKHLVVAEFIEICHNILGRFIRIFFKYIIYPLDLDPDSNGA